MSNKKKKNMSMEKVFETLIDVGIFDKLVEEGGIKLFQSREEMNDFMKIIT